jgi:hypothetical protein
MHSPLAAPTRPLQTTHSYFWANYLIIDVHAHPQNACAVWLRARSKAKRHGPPLLRMARRRPSATIGGPLSTHSRHMCATDNCPCVCCIPNVHSLPIARARPSNHRTAPVHACSMLMILRAHSGRAGGWLSGVCGVNRANGIQPLRKQPHCVVAEMAARCAFVAGEQTRAARSSWCRFQAGTRSLKCIHIGAQVMPADPPGTADRFTGCTTITRAAHR